MDMRKRRYFKILATLPVSLIERLDELAEEVNLSRSEVISDICRYVLDDEELIDEIYPYEEDT